jgi:diguanylate cyclase (GGDEF)-like protein
MTLPTKAHLYTTAVIVAGWIALGWVWASTAHLGWDLLGPQPIIFVIFGGLLLATEMRPMPDLIGGGEVTASWTFALAMLFMAPPAVTLTIVAVVALTVDLPKSIEKALFNASQFVLSLSVGLIFSSLIIDVDLAVSLTPGLRWVLGALTIAVVAFSLNSALISVVIALHQGLPIVETLRRSFLSNLGMDGLLLALAPVFAVIGLNAPLLVLPLLVTVAVIFRSASIALGNRHEATHDLLTGIANRRLFEDRSQMLLDGALSAGSRAALIHFDLDGFKAVNDRLGHHYGDEVLRKIAQRIKASSRSFDQVARLGGDEFAILLGRIETSDDAVLSAQRVLEVIEEPMEIEGVPLGISASLGVAIYPDHGEDLVTLTHHADMASYTAKRSGIGVSMWQSEDGSSMPGRLSLLGDLRRAVENDELSLVFQPIVETATDRIAGMEALVRWHHPTRQLILPEVFIRQAEQTDLVTPITDLILLKAISQCAAWHAGSLEVRVAVNVSARNLHDLRFPGRVAAILSQQGLEPQWLEIEVTENTVMADPVKSAAVLRELRGLGVSVAIDDFGTGYSSLASLRSLKLDRVKIDRTFITELDTNESDLMIARSVVELGNNLGLGTVAEGVETAAVLRIVRELGCHEYQGYYVCRPTDAESLMPLLVSNLRDRAPLHAFDGTEIRG